MSYGLKYWLKFYDVLSPETGSEQWSVNVYENGYSGANSAVVGTAEPVTINYAKQDLQSPIMGSECVFSLLTSSVGQYDEFLTADPLQYYIQIFQGETLYWQGVNTTDMMRRKDAYNPYEIQLKFNCGLGELQWFFYENAGSLFTGYEQIVQIINNCFTFLPYTLPLREIIEIREDTMSNTKGLLEQLYLSDQALNRIANDSQLHGYNCNQILNYILTALNCRIYQCNGMWYIERIPERMNSTVTVFDYTLLSTVQTSNAFTYSATSTLDWRNTVNNASFPKMLNTSDRGVTQKHSSLACKFSVSQFGTVELIPNPYFENDPNDVVGGSPGPLPQRWDRSTAIIAEPIPQLDSVQTIDPFNSNPQQIWGYCFGSKVITDNSNALNAIHGFVPRYGMYNAPYYIHAVQRPGNTSTYPNLLVAPLVGTVMASVGLYFKITCKTSYTGANYIAKSNSDAALLYNASFMPSIETYFKDASGNKFYIYRDFSDYVSNPPEPQGWNPLGVPITMAYLVANASYINSGGIYPAGFFSWADVIRDLQDTYTANTGEVSFEFMLYYSKTTALGFLAAANYSFDTIIRAPWFGCGPSATMEVEPDFGIDYIDIQYIENAQTTNGYTAFFSAPDVEERWAELDIDIVFADGVTNSYPGAWRVASLAETVTWHNLVGTIVSGQLLPTLLFAHFLSIIDVYRKALTANMNGLITFQDTILDEDGTLYCQTGHTFNIKSNKYTIDMEEMAQLEPSEMQASTFAGTSNFLFVDSAWHPPASPPPSENTVITNIASSSAKVVIGSSSQSLFPKSL